MSSYIVKELDVQNVNFREKIERLNSFPKIH